MQYLSTCIHLHFGTGRSRAKNGSTPTDWPGPSGGLSLVVYHSNNKKRQKIKNWSDTYSLYQDVSGRSIIDFQYDSARFFVAVYGLKFLI